MVVAAGVAASLLASGPLAASADDITDAQARLQVIGKLKGTLQDNLQKAQAQEVALQQQIQETRDTINQTIDHITAAEQKISELERQIAALDAKIADERLLLKRTKAEYAAFVRATYKSDADPFAMLLGSPNFQTFLNRAVAIEHQHGCSQLGGDAHLTEQILTGLGIHPNVAGTLVVSLGC